MEYYIKKYPINGFISVCLKCKSNKVKVEVREDGVDFQCQKCGNKMLIRPGESFQVQVPEERIEEKAKEFREQLNKSATEEEIDAIIDAWIKKQEGQE